MATFFTHWIGFEAIKRYIDNLKEKGATETGVFDSQMETVLQRLFNLSTSNDERTFLTHLLIYSTDSALAFAFPILYSVKCVSDPPLDKSWPCLENPNLCHSQEQRKSRTL